MGGRLGIWLVGKKKLASFAKWRGSKCHISLLLKNAVPYSRYKRSFKLLTMPGSNVWVYTTFSLTHSYRLSIQEAEALKCELFELFKSLESFEPFLSSKFRFFRSKPAFDLAKPVEKDYHDKHWLKPEKFDLFESLLNFAN